MPKMPRAPRQHCARCGGRLALPHQHDDACRLALSSEIDRLLTRARKLSIEMWKLARVERRMAGSSPRLPS
jgi:hypothetical protein